jgi:tetratricopeptide (TPR) repeat protein
VTKATGGFHRTAIAALLCFAACAAPPAAASPTPPDEPSAPRAEAPYSNYLPPLDSLALPSEQSVFEDFVTKERAAGKNPAASLAAADEALGELTAPTRLRGFVQFLRAGALVALNRPLDAADAVQESARLLRGYSAPLILAFTIDAHLNRTDSATEYLMRAVDADPTTARTIDDYEIGNLMGRLSGFHDETRERAVSDRLLQIGWEGKHLDSRSNLAAQAIKLHISNGDPAGAKALVPRLLTPSDSRDLLMMKQYSAVWPDIETWAGPQLKQQWSIYLSEAKARWEAGRTTQTARDYLSALQSAGDYEGAAREILPLFDAPQKDEELVFMVPRLADVLSELGRWNEAEKLYQRAQQIWPLGSEPNALNVSANYAVLLLREGKAREGLQQMDEVLADARKWGPDVGVTPLAAMQDKRACMLHELGRNSEAAISAAQALAVETGSTAATLHLCLGDSAAAKRDLLRALDNETTREDVVRFMQPSDSPPLPSDYGRRMYAAEMALRSDPDVIRAVSKYGRILPWPVNARAASSGEQ